MERKKHKDVLVSSQGSGERAASNAGKGQNLNKKRAID